MISSLTLQEAKDSSAIENIVTTHDELFRVGDAKAEKINLAAKEVENYRVALLEGYRQTLEKGLIRATDILHLQSLIEPDKAGIRKIPGTVIGNATTKEVIYTPPQQPDEINRLLDNLVTYINDDELSELDPLIKMAISLNQSAEHGFVEELKVERLKYIY